MAASMAFLANSFPDHGVEGAVGKKNTPSPVIFNMSKANGSFKKVEIRYNTSEGLQQIV